MDAQNPMVYLNKNPSKFSRVQIACEFSVKEIIQLKPLLPGQVLDTEKVQRWHRALQRTIEEETRLANLYWLELSLPSK